MNNLRLLSIVLSVALISLSIYWYVGKRQLDERLAEERRKLDFEKHWHQELHRAYDDIERLSQRPLACTIDLAGYAIAKEPGEQQSREIQMFLIGCVSDITDFQRCVSKDFSIAQGIESCLGKPEAQPDPEFIAGTGAEVGGGISQMVQKRDEQELPQLTALEKKRSDEIIQVVRLISGPSASTR